MVLPCLRASDNPSEPVRHAPSGPKLIANDTQRRLLGYHPPVTQPQPDRVERLLGLVLLVLIAYRIAYHATYLGEVAFAHATFSTEPSTNRPRATSSSTCRWAAARSICKAPTRTCSRWA